MYGQRIDEIRLPESETRRAALAVQYGKDGYHLLEAVRAPGAPAWLRELELPAVETLRAVWIQQYYRNVDEHGEKVIRREASEHGLPPGRLQLVCPYDLDARYSEKHGKGWEGYKVHVSGTCHEPEPDDTRQAPNLITNVATTEATVPDVAMTEPIHDMLDAVGLLPGEHAAGRRVHLRGSAARRAHGASPWSARCSLTPRPRPGPAGTPPRRSPSTGSTSR